MLDTLAAVFWWPTMAEDVGAFVGEFLHCMVTAGSRVLRPFGETLRATKPNELHRFDFLSIVEGNGGAKYVLDLKDGMSEFVELVGRKQASSEQVYQVLISWFMRFGVARHWVSDEGDHFHNSLIELLQRALGSQHHFTTAYTPWANGSVEVVSRVVLKVMKVLLSERRLHVKEWPSVIPVFQAALNSIPTDRLDGVSPLTVFTALPDDSQLRSILDLRPAVNAEVEWVDTETKHHLTSIRGALDQMHAEMVDVSERRRRAARERHAERQGVRLQRFSEGDFVLAAVVTGRIGNKLAMVCRGPKHVLKVLNDFTLEVQDLVNRSR